MSGAYRVTPKRPFSVKSTERITALFAVAKLTTARITVFLGEHQANHELVIAIADSGAALSYVSSDFDGTN